MFLLSKDQGSRELLLWEPITGAHQRVPVPAAFVSVYEDAMSPGAAVFCAADGCDHGDCLGGPFRVVFIFAVVFVTSACVYSSETGTWGEPALLQGQVGQFTEYGSVLVGNSLVYFLSDGEAIMEYDLARHSLTEFDLPDESYEGKFTLILSEKGELVVSESLKWRLNLWSREWSRGTGAPYVLSRVINLENLLPNGAFVDPVYVLGFAAGANAIFVRTVVGLFMIDLQSYRVRKVCDFHGYYNLIPVIGFYTPRPRLRALRVKHHDPPPPPRNPTKEEALKFAHKLFDKGCKATQERNFANASHCFSRALNIRVLHYGKLAPQCASTFYRYGHALLHKALAATNSSGRVSKSALNEESVKITSITSKDDAGSSSASDKALAATNVEHVLPSKGDDSEEGENLNHKDKGINMTENEGVSDLHLAWKMLDIAREIVVKSPEKRMEKANIFHALAEVSMKRGDRDSAIGYYLEALDMLEHLCRPDDLRVVQLYPLCGDSSGVVSITPPHSSIWGCNSGVSGIHLLTVAGS
ncbi:hypothetical protein ACQ4PT_032933 [Festuca glaucescens]